MELRLPFLFLVATLLGGAALSAERIPPAPTRYFNDYAGVVSGPVAGQLNAQLEQFERASSNQLLVAIYPKMESDSSVEDYTVRVAQAWKAGQTGKNNGAVLFAFMAEHKLYLQVGYGLESVLPDATAKRIIEREIVPRFRAHDIDGGMTAAVNAMIAATKGEYTGTGSTVADGRRANGNIKIENSAWVNLLFLVAVLVFAFRAIRRAGRNPTLLMNPGRRSNSWINFGGSSDSGSSWGGSSGGGDFSGGGGSFGGGGAGGSW